MIRPARIRASRLPVIAGACLGACAVVVAGASVAQTGAQTGAPTNGQARPPIDELDVEPPLIEHAVLAEAEVATRQSFVAQVVDDRALASVRLRWRYAGQSAYVDAPMERVSRSSTWLGQVTTDPDEPRDIEYWIEARDAGGNRTVRGFAFSPLARRILPRPGDASAGAGRAGGPGRGAVDGTAAGTGPVGNANEAGGSRRALWVVLGALGVALVVGLASSGGGGDGGGESPPSGGGACSPEGCRIVLTFDPPVAP